MTELTFAIGLLLLGIIIWLFARHAGPTLNAGAPQSRVPAGLNHAELIGWLETEEASLPIVPGAESRILLASLSRDGNGLDTKEQNNKTPVSILHIHGFSACRQETAPVAEQLADRLGAHLVEARLAGHGLMSQAMEASAEDWLQSVTDGMDLAHRLGERVLIIGTSTGAPLGCWAAKVLAERYGSPLAMMYMAPNFGINQSFAWLLTLPGSRFFIPLILGPTRTWEAESDAVAKYWSTSYSTLAVIEMQKVVDWFEAQSPASWNVPLGIMLGDLDPTISAKKALRVLEKWGDPRSKRLPIPEQETMAQHVFVGDIAGPDLTAHCVDQFELFAKECLTDELSPSNAQSSP